MKKWLKRHQKIIFWSAFGLLLIVWTLSRFYNLADTWLFFGDNARDYLAVYNFRYHQQMMWLGPQNSATPLSQSVFYFYLLTPLLLASNFAFFANQLTLLIFTWTIFFLCARLVRKKPVLYAGFFITVLLFLFYPQSILQSRDVWNPSFAWQPLLLAFFLWQSRDELSARLKHCLEFLIGVLLAFSVSMSFVFVPILVAFLLLIIFSKISWQKYLLGCVGGLLGFFSPMLIFELRHGWQITSRFFSSLSGDMVRINSEGGGLDLLSKINDLGVLFADQFWILYVLLIICVVLAILQFKKNRSLNLFLAATGSFVIVLVISFLFPVRMHAHYVWTLFVCLVLLVATAPKKINLAMAFLLLVFWLPNSVKIFTQTILPPYTFAQLETCAQKICQQHNEPLFVALESPSHNHFGNEFMFSLAKNGCTVLDIGTVVGQVGASASESAKTMIIFARDSSYVQGKTSFYELSLFGDHEASVATTGVCSERLAYTVLVKDW